ncbi:ABC transporter permease subunit [Roseinatronobacter sp. S2]|uniref:ABC transporter permease subunit n=1 Tax=Roseinatronobacter sp. S2 TaxID=3035471 RepID=UPI002410A23E|nr:ABC transporter permease subunit [Roseinatronobacter sp. S2]MCC5958191.1 ABC transporter permease subunit [Paracoccaceae bacterium]WFE74063.1 ABC transporter permease subunit [Roseinatronobacter sp. S2]
MRGWFLPVAVLLGFIFLYAPIISLVVFSFNDSRLVTVWGGFSTRWYGELLNDRQIMGAAWVSLKVAFFSATLATVIGTLGAFVLTRFSRFTGRLLLTGMITAPLVMPEVITGLSLLLLFISMELTLGWPAGRGMVTVIIAHTTFCAAFVAVIAQSRLRSMDESLEEAARDLGAGPVRVFFDVTLPVIAPALVSGWLLAFTLSLDDLVIASFVTGPGASTLPMVIFSKVRLGVSPDVNALATIIIGFVFVAVLAAGWLMRKQMSKGL